MQRRSRGAFALWVTLYLTLVILPLPLALISLDPGRGFWINFSVALGFVGLAMFGLQFVMAARSRIVVHPVGMDVVLQFHKQVAYLATVLVFAHPIILFLVNSEFLGLLDVLTSPLRAKFAVTSCVALLVLIVLSVYRRRLRLSYPAWQFTHAALALVVVVTALAHALLVGYYIREPWEQALWIVLTIAFVALGIWVRLIKPLLRHRRRWVVESLERATDDTTTITLRLADPAAHGDAGFRFEPGQFAWLIARRSPFALTYHPFSFASSAEDHQRVRFTIREFDNFSHDVADLQVGETVYLDGPFGAFVLPDRAPLVLIGAGVGVTPLVSMLETLADRGDDRPIQLWLGNRREDSIPCREEIDRAAQRLDLTVTHVISRPSPTWEGATGRVDGAFVSARTEGLPAGTVFCLCGPDAMMDDVEAALTRAGIPADDVRSERFGMV
ncbi:ferredoxin reductase family protein [Serinibacter salmoneus]|uniref:ferredoxin reductase family protein n=1 Tax=Serinibacter salmoneus TaxID=556530 RepID=UPI001474B7F4|nr:ferric reductase-like transmembrane domain-containing protein [Serinibacter salmoneus]